MVLLIVKVVGFCLLCIVEECHGFHIHAAESSEKGLLEIILHQMHIFLVLDVFAGGLV